MFIRNPIQRKVSKRRRRTHRGPSKRVNELPDAHTPVMTHPGPCHTLMAFGPESDSLISWFRVNIEKTKLTGSIFYQMSIVRSFLVGLKTHIPANLQNFVQSHFNLSDYAHCYVNECYGDEDAVPYLIFTNAEFKVLKPFFQEKGGHVIGFFGLPFYIPNSSNTDDEYAKNEMRREGENEFIDKIREILEF